MESLYWEPPTAADLINTAWTLDDYPEPQVEVWDENWDVLHLFRLYSTQWRMASVGPAGLDFNVFHHALDRKGISGEEYDTWVSQLRQIESEAMRQIHRK